MRSTTASGVGPGQGSLVYESSRAVDEYLQFHFADPKELLPFECGPVDALNFPARLAKLCDEWAPKSSPRCGICCCCSVPIIMGKLLCCAFGSRSLTLLFYRRVRLAGTLRCPGGHVPFRGRVPPVPKG